MNQPLGGDTDMRKKLSISIDLFSQNASNMIKHNGPKLLASLRIEVYYSFLLG